MQSLKPSCKERIGAALLIAMGLGIMNAGYSYELGTLRHMGPGLVPFALGAMLSLVGLLIGATTGGGDRARRLPGHEVGHGAGHGEAQTDADWRGWLCILGGVVSFVLLGHFGGLVPASFAAVFLSALGDREATLRESAGLAAATTAAGVAIFHYGLHLQLPLFRWG